MRAFSLWLILGTFAVYGCNDSGFSSRNDKARHKSAKPGTEDAAGADGGSSVKDDDDGADGSGTGADGNPGADGSGGIKVSPETDNGAPVQSTNLKLGINFEDRGLLGDRDYNDDVLCFEGKFEVTKATGVIKSLADQQVLASINRNANCEQRITVTITHPDGTKTEMVREPLQNTLISETLTFKSGSTMEVIFQALNPKCDVQVHRVTEPNFVMFGFDVCNL